MNPLFSGRQDLIVGKEFISFNHVRMVYNNFKVDDHKLKIEDIERIDSQNWGSAQRIASRHVQRCLKEKMYRWQDREDIGYRDLSSNCR